MEWQPIETLESQKIAKSVIVGRWSDFEGKRYWCQWLVSEGDERGTCGILGYPPTHWQPLPPPPE